MPLPYTIAGLAAAAGVHIETIRYYQRLNLVAEPARLAGSIRRYGEPDAERVRFIKRAQAMGFTLAEVRQLPSLRAHGSCRTTREFAAAKLHDIDARIRELDSLRSELAGLIAACDTNRQDRECPVIRRLVTRPSGSG